MVGDYSAGLLLSIGGREGVLNRKATNEKRDFSTYYKGVVFSLLFTFLFLKNF
jgi:hypothetical protein